MDYQEHFYTSDNGLHLYYREYGGADQTVICLPGLTRNSKDFHEIALHLSSHYRVICADLRGRGQSEHDPKQRNYNITEYMPDVRRLMDDAKIENAIFLGTSLGGLISMTIAYQNPERIRAIILNDIGPEADPVGIARILSYVGTSAPANNWDEAIARIRETYAISLPNMPDSFWAEFVHKSYREDPEGVPELEMDPRIGGAVRVALKSVKFLNILKKLRLLRHIRGVPLDPWESFRAVSMPCLVLRGALSDILSEEIMDRMQTIKPDLQRAIIPDRGHAPLLDEPESMRAIDDFLGNLV